MCIRDRSIATNAGAAGTFVENFGVGSSVTIAGRKAIINPTSDLTTGETYHISYPSGAFTNTSGDVSYVGTAYTFGVKPPLYELWAWGQNTYGELANNINSNYYSSPVQIPGTTWKSGNFNNRNINAIKTDGSLWGVGYNGHGSLGMNNTTQYSSPIQVPGVTTWDLVWGADEMTYAVRTDGTLWTWGNNESGSLGHNQSAGANSSSPIQVPGTTWSSTPMQGGAAQTKQGSVAMKTDGTLWRWGNNNKGALGQNDIVDRSSPVQVGSDTTWVQAQIGNVGETYAIKQL